MGSNGKDAVYDIFNEYVNILLEKKQYAKNLGIDNQSYIQILSLIRDHIQRTLNTIDCMYDQLNDADIENIRRCFKEGCDMVVRKIYNICTTSLLEQDILISARIERLSQMRSF